MIYGETLSTFNINPALLKDEGSKANRLFTKIKATLVDGKSKKIVDARGYCQSADDILKKARNVNLFKYVVSYLQKAYDLLCEADSDLRWTCLTDLKKAKEIYFSLVEEEARNWDASADVYLSKGEINNAKACYYNAIQQYEISGNQNKIAEMNRKSEGCDKHTDYLSAQNFVRQAKSFQQTGEHRKAIDSINNAINLFVSSGHREELSNCEQLKSQLSNQFSKTCESNNQTGTEFENSANAKMKQKQFGEAINFFKSAQNKYNVAENFEASKRCEKRIKTCNDILGAYANFNNGLKFENQNDLINAGYEFYKARYVFDVNDLKEEVVNCTSHINKCEAYKSQIENQAQSLFERGKQDYYENEMDTALQKFKRAKELYQQTNNDYKANQCNTFIENSNRIYVRTNSTYNNALKSMKNGEYWDAISSFKFAMPAYEECGITKFVDYCKQNIEKCNAMLNSTHTSTQNNSQPSNNNQSNTEIENLINSGWNNYNNGYYQDAIDCFNKAKSKSKSSDCEEECEEAINTCLHAIGVNYYNSGIHNSDYFKAISELETAKDYFKSAGFYDDARDCDDAIESKQQKQEEENYKQGEIDFREGNDFASREDWFHAKQCYESALENGYDNVECEQAIRECEDELRAQYYR